jgi:hypothetical protein
MQMGFFAKTFDRFRLSRVAMPDTDRGNDRCRNQRPHSFDGGYAPAIRRVLKGDLNPLIGSGDLLVQLRKLFVETLKKHPSKTCQLVHSVFEHRRQAAAHLPMMLWQYDPILSQQASDLVDELRPIRYQPAVDTVQALQILLFDGFRRNETHVGPRHGFANRFRIVGIVLLGLYIRLLYKLGCHQPNCMPEAAEHARPVTRAAAGLDPHQAGRLLRKEPDDFVPPQLPPQYRASRPVRSVSLKDLLRYMQLNRSCLRHAVPSS